MTLAELQTVLGWSLIIHLAILLWWAGWFLLARDLVFRIHSRWFKLSEQHFDSIHYCAIGLFKLLILVFNLVPWLALLIVA